jgi:hypothetical protein
MSTNTRFTRWTSAIVTTACLAGAPAFLAGCDRTESKEKTTTTKITDQGDTVKKTTETTEKKVEKSP